MVEAPGVLLAGDGLRLDCTAAGHFAAGVPVRAFLRPEHLRLGVGTLSAEVTGIEFLGPVCRLALSAGGLVLEADATPELVVRLGAVPGTVLPVTLPHDRLMVFPAHG